MLQKFKEDKNPGSTNRYTNFGQLIIGEIIKIIATGCHIFKAKMHQIRFLASVRLSFYLFVVS